MPEQEVIRELSQLHSERRDTVLRKRGYLAGFGASLVGAVAAGYEAAMQSDNRPAYTVVSFLCSVSGVACGANAMAERQDIQSLDRQITDFEDYTMLCEQYEILYASLRSYLSPLEIGSGVEAA